MPIYPIPKSLFGKEIRKKYTFSSFLYKIERYFVYLQRVIEQMTQDIVDYELAFAVSSCPRNMEIFNRTALLE